MRAKDGIFFVLRESITGLDFAAEKSRMNRNGMKVEVVMVYGLGVGSWTGEREGFRRRWMMET